MNDPFAFGGPLRDSSSVTNKKKRARFEDCINREDNQRREIPRTITHDEEDEDEDFVSSLLTDPQLPTTQTLALPWSQQQNLPAPSPLYPMKQPPCDKPVVQKQNMLLTAPVVAPTNSTELQQLHWQQQPLPPAPTNSTCSKLPANTHTQLQQQPLQQPSTSTSIQQQQPPPPPPPAPTCSIQEPTKPDPTKFMEQWSW